MDIKMQAKSEVDRSLLIEDSYIEKWGETYLLNMQNYRYLSRPIFHTDETYIDPNAQPSRFLTDCTIKSSADVDERGYSTGLSWNAGYGNRLLILQIIGGDGLIREAERIRIRNNRQTQSDDYHEDIPYPR